jgi:hypothetical protein
MLRSVPPHKPVGALPNGVMGTEPINRPPFQIAKQPKTPPSALP